MLTANNTETSFGDVVTGVCDPGQTTNCSSVQKPNVVEFSEAEPVMAEMPREVEMPVFIHPAQHKPPIGDDALPVKDNVKRDTLMDRFLILSFGVANNEYMSMAITYLEFAICIFGFLRMFWVNRKMEKENRRYKETNHILAERVQEFTETNIALKHENLKFKDNNDHLHEQIQEFGDRNVELIEMNVKFESCNGKLEQQVKGLTETGEMMSQKVEKLEDIRDHLSDKVLGLEDIKEKMAEQNESLETKLMKFEEVAVWMQKSSKNTKESVDGVLDELSGNIRLSKRILVDTIEKRKEMRLDGLISYLHQLEWRDTHVGFSKREFIEFERRIPADIKEYWDAQVGGWQKLVARHNNKTMCHEGPKMSSPPTSPIHSAGFTKDGSFFNSAPNSASPPPNRPANLDDIHITLPYDVMIETVTSVFQSWVAAQEQNVMKQGAQIRYVSG